MTLLLKEGGKAYANKTRGNPPRQTGGVTSRAQHLVAVGVLLTFPMVHPLGLMRPYHRGSPRIHRWRHMDQTAFGVRTPVNQQWGAAVQHVFCIHLLLQQYQPFQHRFRAWGAASNVDVNRDDPINALHSRIVAIKSPRGGTRAEGHHPFRLAHLVVDALEHWGNFMVDGAYDHQQVGL